MSDQDPFRIEGSVQAGTFRVERAVAEGGFAVVYRAYHTAFRAPVALKCLKVPSSLSGAHQAAFLEQFRAEAEVLFRLSARIPTVVRPLHAGTLEGASVAFVPYLAMEWLEGATLEELLEQRMRDGRGPFSLDELTRLLMPAAEGLHQAHSFAAADGTLSVLHRDLKPANLFIATIDGKRIPKVLDFGIAKVKSAATAIVGKTSLQGGMLPAFTPSYAAPEQWAPKRFGQTGPWTDVWGLALTMLEAILGRPPIDGDHAAMLGAALDPAVRPTPRSLGMTVSDAVEAVFLKALAVDPRDRYLTIADFYAELRKALRAAATGAGDRPPATGALAYARTLQLESPAVAATERPDPRPEQATAAAVPALAPIPGLRPRPEPVAPLPAEPPSRGTKDTLAVVERFTQLVDPAPLVAREPAAPQRAPPPRDAPPPPAGTSAPERPARLAGAPARAPRAAPPRDAPDPQREHFHRGLDQLARQARAAQARSRAEREAVGTLRERLLLPAGLVVTGIVIAGLALIYSAYGDALPELPLRPLWVAGPLVFMGLSLGLYRLFLTDE